MQDTGTAARLAPRTMQRPSTISARQRLFEEVLVAMEQRLDEPGLVLDDLAGALFTSRRQLQRVFTEQGTSFRTELVRLRMRRAAALLDASPTTHVRAIAREVGYLQPAQFAKAFRRVHGVSPREHRAGRTVPADERRNGTAGPLDGLARDGQGAPDDRP